MTTSATVHNRLEEFNLTNTWLIAELQKRGLVVSKTELSSILNNKRFGNKASRALQLSMEILEEYEKAFVRT